MAAGAFEHAVAIRCADAQQYSVGPSDGDQFAVGIERCLGAYVWVYRAGLALIEQGAIDTTGWFTTMPLAEGQRAFEELVRRFNEENNEEAGEHWTPRDAVKLMARLIFLPIADQIPASRCQTTVRPNGHPRPAGP